MVAITLVFCLTVNTNSVFATPVTNVLDDVNVSYEKHDSYINKKQEVASETRSTPISTYYYGTDVIGNEYIEFAVGNGNAGFPGRFTIGTVEGSPNYTSDIRERGVATYTSRLLEKSTKLLKKRTEVEN